MGVRSAMKRLCEIHQTRLNGGGKCYWCEQEIDESVKPPFKTIDIIVHPKVPWALTPTDKRFLREMRIATADPE
jgi:hypothetical protein